ncbi:MAG: sigma-70 family RNA polymerase sigma factor [Ruminiclostridium sp.]|nr:sigma-70 family RNA polymerase sigma factor [Ruminiclostridium sp.]
MLVYLALIARPKERARFEELYTRYGGLMHHVAMGILGNEKDAEDAVHEAFLAMSRHMNKVGEVGDPRTKAYVVTIAQRKAIDLCRQRTRRPVTHLEEAGLGLTTVHETDNGLARCMLKLPDRDRQFVLLKFDQGYTTKEIADMMGLTLSAAYKVEQRAKARLETLCREEGLL